MTKTKCSFIGILGAPNAGKSTLLNRVVGSKISIVTPKVQTTRTRITGIAMEGEAQLIFVDTPGIFTPKKNLDKAMVKAAWQGVEGVDFSILLVDSRKGICPDTETILKGLTHSKTPLILVLNKIDMIDRAKLIDLTQKLNDRLDFVQTFMISALKGDGVKDLLSYLAKNAPEGQWMYPEDQTSDIPIRMLASEVTREKLMLRMNKEIPYQVMVETESFEEKKAKGKKPACIDIHQVIYVTNDNYKKMIVGKGGQSIKNIGEMSRKELSWMFDVKVNLFLFVKVKENWLDSPDSYRIMGLDLIK